MRLWFCFSLNIWTTLLAFSLSFFCFCTSCSAEDPLKAVYANLDRLKAYAQGFALLQKGKPEEAEPLMRQIVDFRPENPAALQNYGFLLVRLGKFEESIKILKHAVELEPTLSSAWGNLGGAYASLGQIDNAINSYKKFVELSKNDPKIDTYKSMLSILQEQAKQQKDHPEASKEDYYQDIISFKGKMSWPLGKNPIRVYIEPGVGKKEFKPHYTDLLKKAFSEWSSASNDKIKFEFVNESPGAQIYCSWTDSSKNLIAQAEGGHAKVEYASSVIGRCDITLLTISPCQAVEMNDCFAYKVCLHEVGHALGLLGHSRNSKDSLFCGINLSVLEGKLSDRDIKTLDILYQSQYSPPVVSEEEKDKHNRNYADMVSFAKKANDRGEYDLAQSLYSKAAKEIVPLGLKDVRIAKALISSGQACMQLKKGVEAEIILRAALNLLDSNDDAAPVDIAVCCKNLGEVYLTNKDLPEAKYYLNRSKYIFNELNCDAEVSNLDQSLKECP